MDRSSTAREALVAELMCDMMKLLDRVDAVTPAIDNARQQMTTAAHELAAGVAPFKAHMVGIAAETRETSLQNIERATNQAAAKLLEAQTRAMTASARALFDKEVGPSLNQLARKLEQLVEQTRRPWEPWATHAATATATAFLSTMLVLYVVYRPPSQVQASVSTSAPGTSGSDAGPIQSATAKSEGRTGAASSLRVTKEK